jgi:hypothetical protein
MRFLDTWPVISLGTGGLIAAAQASVPVPDTISGIEKLGAFSVVVVLMVTGISALWWRLNSTDKNAADERERWRDTLENLGKSQDNVARSVDKLADKITNEMRTDLKELARHREHD